MLIHLEGFSIFKGNPLSVAHISGQICRWGYKKNHALSYVYNKVVTDIEQILEMRLTKINATKTNHKNIVTYTQAEIIKCSLGDATLNLVNSSGSPDPFDCSPSTKAEDYISAFVVHFQGSIKKPL